jgi:hypothetical protein
VEAAAIDESQVALLASIGSPVIGVFQTLLAGKTEHLVPGSNVPEVFDRRLGAARPAVASAEFIGATKLNTTAMVETLATTIAREALRRDMNGDGQGGQWREKPGRARGRGKDVDSVGINSV